jgi:O-antigen ligase
MAVLFATGELTWRLNTTKLFFASLFIAAAAGAYALYVTGKGGDLLVPRWFLPAFGSYLLYSALIPLWSNQSYRPALQFSELALFVLLAFLLVQTVRKEKTFDIVLLSVFAAVLVLSVLGIVEYAGVRLFPFTSAGAKRISVTMGNPNYYAGAMVILIPLIVGWLAGRLPVRPALLTAGLLTIFAAIVSVLLTKTRGAWAGLAAGMVLFSVLAFRVRAYRPLSSSARRKALLAVALFLLIVAAVFLGLWFTDPAFGERFQGLDITELSVIEVLGARYNIWRAAISIWTRSPVSLVLGNGLGSYKRLSYAHTPADYRLYSPERGGIHAHNEYLEQLVEGGLVGLIPWLVLIAASAHSAIVVLRKKDAPMNRRLFAAAVLSAMAGALIHASVSLVLRTAGVRLLFFFLCALAFVNRQMALGVTREMRRGWRIPMTVLIIAFIAVFSLFHVTRHFVSETYLLRGLRAAGRGDFVGKSGAQSLYDRATSAFSQDLEARYFKLLSLGDAEPQQVVGLADEILHEIPAYKNVLYLKGLYQINAADPKAVRTLKKWLGYDTYMPETYFHLATSQIMTGDIEGAVETLSAFFITHHRWRLRNEIPDLHSPGLEVSQESLGNLPAPDPATPMVISRPFLEQLLEGISLEAPNYGRALSMLYFYTGRIYEETGYGDLELDYYIKSIEGMRSDSDPVRHVLLRIGHYYELSLEEWQREGGRDAARRLLKYVRLLLRIEPTDDLRALEKELVDFKDK